MRKLSHFIFLFPLLALIAMGGVSCSKQAQKAKHMQRADQYFAAGDYDRAEIEYISVLRIDAMTPNAFLRLGTMAFEQGRLGRAYAYLRRAGELAPNDLDVRLKLGLFYLTAGRPKNAGEAASYVLDHRPQDEEAPLLLADSTQTSADMDAARLRLQKLVVPPGKRAPVEVALGNLAFRQRDPKSAQAAFERAKALDPKYAPLYGSLGNFYWSQKDLAQAEAAYKMAAEFAPARSQRWLKYAQFKIQNGDVPGGRRVLEAAIAKAPDFLSATLALAEISAGEKKYEEARELLGKVLARDPENYDAMFLSGRLGMLQGDPARAVGEFEKMAAIYQKSPIILYQLGLAYNAADDTAKGMASLNQAILLNPGFAEAILALAQMKVAKGDLSSAIASLKQLVQQHPQMASAQMLLAEAYDRQGNLDDAAKVYRQLKDAFPQNAQAPLMLGAILMRQGKRDEARREFTKSLELAPGYLNALEQLTDLEVSDRHYAAALEEVQKMMDKDPKAPEPSLLVAKIYMAKGDVKQATTVLQKTIDAQPDFNIGYLMLARVYNESHQSEQALKTLHALLARHPDDPGGLMLLGTIQDQLKDYKGAQESYERVLAKNPKNSGALNNLAYNYSEHGQVNKADDLARRARDLMPYDPFAADTLGWILFKKDEYPQAVNLLQESANKLASMPDIQLHLGMARYMLGEEASARASLQYAVQSKMEFDGKDQANLCLSILAVDPKTAKPEVRALLEKRVADNPDDAVALDRLAAIYKRDGDGDKAIRTYEAALKANPKNARALFDLAKLYSTRPSERAKAFGLAKAAYKLMPDDVEVSRMLGRLAFQEGDYKLSLNLLQGTVQKRPNDPELLFDLAESAYSVGQVADAEAGMRSALQSSAGFSRATEAKRFLELVPLANHPAQATAAVARVEQTLKSEPEYVPALMALGVIHEQKPDLRAARETFEKVLSRYPDFLPAKGHLAILYAQAPGDEKRANEIATRAHAAFPEDAQITKALGIITFRQGDYAKSAKLLQGSAAKLNGDAQLLYYLGMAQYQLKDRVASKQSLLRAMELKLPEKLAAEAQRVLTELK